MPISQTDQLFSLIKSLSKAEKRNFRLYSKRNQDNQSMMFVQLFDLLDKQKVINEEFVLKKLNGLTASKFSNLKRHLYSQIMNSLHMLYSTKLQSIQVREYLDFADILYSKGLYLQSLKILEKAKKTAEIIHDDLLYLSVIEFEKIIESRHITRSGVDKTLILADEADKRSKRINNSIKLSNLRILLHGMYIQHGHIKNERELEDVKIYFEKNRPYEDISSLSVAEQIYIYQAYVWYYYILLDFEQCFIYAKRWVDLFDKDPVLLKNDPDLYMRGFHYLLTSAYNLEDIDSYSVYLSTFESYRKANYTTFNYNSKIISFLYVHMGRLNLNFLNGTFAEGLLEIPKTLKRLRKYESRMDVHRIMVFYYKFSWMYLAAGKPEEAVDYLNRIIQMEIENLREDMQGYARLMFLMAHYDLENYDIMPYLISQVDSFFKRMQSKNKVQIVTLNFMQKISKAPLSERSEIMKLFNSELSILSKDQYERRAFIYLDIMTWLEAKIQHKTISEIIQERIKKNN